ncbi:hypothetical protein [Streptomyces sp. NPDC059874]|uniref:hypothetical protein n=1 Tax=Streptomyces sp. NPDC059874 TaxID=3346983 RepID=UPI0036559A9D
MTMLPLSDRSELFALFTDRITDPTRTLLSWEFLTAITADEGVRVERRRTNPDATKEEHYVRVLTADVPRAAAYLIFGSGTVEIRLPHDQAAEYEQHPAVTLPTDSAGVQRVFVSLDRTEDAPRTAVLLTRRALVHNSTPAGN